MEKMTNVKAINYVVENFSAELPEDVRTKLENIKASYEKKAQNKKPTKTQEENTKFANIVAEVLADGSAKTVTEIMKSNETLNDLTNQKVTAILRGMVKDKRVVNVKEGKKSTFVLAIAE